MEAVGPEVVGAGGAVGAEDAGPQAAGAGPHAGLDGVDEALALDAAGDEAVDHDAEGALRGEAGAVAGRRRSWRRRRGRG